MARRKYEETYEDSKETIDTGPYPYKATDPMAATGIIDNYPYVKVRKAPSKESDCVKVLKKGDRVQIISQIDGFYKVRFGEEGKGFISLDFCRKES